MVKCTALIGDQIHSLQAIYPWTSATLYFLLLPTRKSSSDLYEEALFQKHTCLSDTMTGRDL